MNSIDKQLLRIRAENRLGLMTHMVIGYPNMKECTKIVLEMIKRNVDFIELQIPFSDPLADGPTIMNACESSLTNGTRVRHAFVLAKKISKTTEVPIIFMAYFNILFKYGVDNFCRHAKLAGVSGLIVPDIPIEEDGEEHFIFFCKKYNLIPIRVISPVSTNERLKKNAKIASGFVYYTAHQGVTGAKSKIDPLIKLRIQKVKKYFSIPIAVGFGISQKEHIKILNGNADIAVVGSAIINVISTSQPHERVKNVGKFIQSLRV